MRNRLVLILAGSALIVGGVAAQSARKPRLNPVIDLLRNRRSRSSVSTLRAIAALVAAAARARPAGPPRLRAPPAAPDKSPAELAKEAVAYKNSDFVFDGSMEGGLDRALPAFTALVAGMKDAGALMKSPLRFTHPLIVKTPESRLARRCTPTSPGS